MPDSGLRRRRRRETCWERAVRDPLLVHCRGDGRSCGGERRFLGELGIVASQVGAAGMKAAEHADADADHQ